MEKTIIESDTKKPGKPRIHYPCIVDTWVCYRYERYNESIDDVAEYIARETGRKANRDNLYMYRSRYRSTPDHILKLLELDYADLIRWVLDRHQGTGDVEAIARELGLPIKKV